MITSKKISLLLLGVTAILSSRALFALFNDPEGPNLLIVMVLAVVVYAVSLAVYMYTPSKQEGPKGILLPLFVQVLLVTCLYFLLK
jgi:hypothetical protein